MTANLPEGRVWPPQSKLLTGGPDPLPTLLLVEAHNPWRCLTVTFHSGYESMTISRTLIGWRVGMTMSNIQLGNMRPGPARPDPITLFKTLYLRNRMSDRQAVFFDEYHWDVKVVWHGYHIASVPVMARGACETWGTLGDPQNTLPQ